jgi:hypothetical protein
MTSIEISPSEQNGTLTVIASLVGGPRRMNSKEKWYDPISTRSLLRQDIIQIERDGIPQGECRADEVPELKEIFDELFPEIVIADKTATKLQLESPSEPIVQLDEKKASLASPIETQTQNSPAVEAVTVPATGTSDSTLSKRAPPKVPNSTSETRSNLDTANTSPSPTNYVALLSSSSQSSTASTFLNTKQIGKSGFWGAVALFVALIVVVAMLQNKKNTSLATLAPDPMECSQRLPAGIVIYYVIHNHTPVRDQPTALQGTGSIRIGFQGHGKVVQGEWVPSPTDQTKCWLKLVNNGGYISEINLSPSPQ